MFLRYLARESKEKSGAYLFLPDGEATILNDELPSIRVFEGPLFTRVEVQLRVVKHIMCIYNTPELWNLGIEVVNYVDILRENNYELAMRLTSNVKNGNEFYTDLNGFQVRFFKKKMIENASKNQIGLICFKKKKNSR